MMCNSWSGRYKVCSYYVIKTICVFPNRKEEARRDGEAGRRKKRKNLRIGSLELVRRTGSWNSSNCHITTEEKCFMYSIIIKCSACLFSMLFASIYWFSNASILRAGEIFTFKLKIDFWRPLKTKIPCGGRGKKKWYPHFKHSILKPKRSLLPLTLKITF